VNSVINHLVTGALKARFLTLLVTLLVVVAGSFAWRVLPLEAYPELANPQVRVITLFAGRGPEEVEKLVSIPLEKELNGIPGEISLRSISVYGLSVVIATFADGTQTPICRQQVLERIAQADIPADATPRLEPDVGSLREIYRYALYSPYYTAMGLRSIQQWELDKLFRQVPGVIGVVSHGGPTKSFQVAVDPYKLRAYNISLQQVYSALNEANATTGGGYIEKDGEALIVRELGLLRDIDDVRKVVIRTTPNGTAVRIGDVATVEVGELPRRGQVGRDKDDDVVEGIVLLRRGENPTQVLKGLYARLPDIISHLPEGVCFQPLYDRNKLVNQTLNTVGTNIAMGITLVLALLTLFLMDLGAALVTATVIPLAMLVAFTGLTLLGVPANLISLGAIDFGILVDSAVVMVENIIRRLSKEGVSSSPVERLALLAESAREVAGPIVSGLVVIVVTFLPIFTFSGVEGKLFRPLATTMVTALIGGGVAALTLVPVLCSFLYQKRPPRERESPIVWLVKLFYRPTLKISLRVSWLVIGGAIAAFCWTTTLFAHLGSEFLPHLEEGNIWLRATIKPGSVTLEESVRVAHEVRARLRDYPEVTQVLSQVGGPDDGTDPSRFADQEYYVDLKPAKEWRPKFKEDKQLLIDSMRAELEQIPGVSYYFTQYIQTTLDEALSGVQGSLVAKISGPDLKELESLAHRVGLLMNDTRGVVDVIVDPLLGQPQVAIEIDRDTASRYGLNVDDLRDLTEIAIGGKSATTIIEGERRFPAIVRWAARYRSTEESLKETLVDTPSGSKIPLSVVAKVYEVNGATQIWRENGSRLATIRANVRGRDLGTTVAEVQKRVAQSLKLPPGYHVFWSGEFQRQREASHQLAVILPVTLMVVISILYFACGTLSGALVMFSVVPLAAIGAVLALYYTHIYFSISAGVGFIALFGLAVKNGILLVSFVNDLRHQGMAVRDAVYEGAVTRMGPVLMTATIAAVGLLPAALSNEIGSQTQKPFAIVIIGGLISCTILSLYVLPSIYLCIAPSPGRASRKGESAGKKGDKKGLAPPPDAPKVDYSFGENIANVVAPGQEEMSDSSSSSAPGESSAKPDATSTDSLEKPEAEK
jgi:heavy metal efflux system protein